MYVGISKRFRFEASHQLPGYSGKCAHLHGHSYKLEVKVLMDPTKLDACGIALDFDTLKQAVHAAVIDRYDHKHLNDFFDHPTAEVMVMVFQAHVSTQLSKLGVFPHLVHLTLWETETCCASYPELPRV